MTSAIESLALRATNNKVAALEAIVKRQTFVIQHLASAMYHHVQDRHDAHMKCDDAPDVRAIHAARRSLQAGADMQSRNIAEVTRGDRTRSR